jgi:hypothetical protein
MKVNADSLFRLCALGKAENKFSQNENVASFGDRSQKQLLEIHGTLNSHSQHARFRQHSNDVCGSAEVLQPFSERDFFHKLIQDIKIFRAENIVERSGEI